MRPRVGECSAYLMFVMSCTGLHGVRVDFTPVDRSARKGSEISPLFRIALSQGSTISTSAKNSSCLLSVVSDGGSSPGSSSAFIFARCMALAREPAVSVALRL